jgi:hypothetical protein
VIPIQVNTNTVFDLPPNCTLQDDGVVLDGTPVATVYFGDILATCNLPMIVDEEVVVINSTTKDGVIFVLKSLGDATHPVYWDTKNKVTTSPASSLAGIAPIT